MDNNASKRKKGVTWVAKKQTGAVVIRNEKNEKTCKQNHNRALDFALVLVRWDV